MFYSPEVGQLNDISSHYYHPNVFSHVCLFTVGSHVIITHDGLDLPPDMVKLVQLGPHCTGTSSPKRCSHLFIVKHVGCQAGGSYPTGMLSCFLL